LTTDPTPVDGCLEVAGAPGRKARQATQLATKSSSSGGGGGGGKKTGVYKPRMKIWPGACSGLRALLPPTEHRGKALQALKLSVSVCHKQGRALSAG
jgi:hypothetical protein